MKPAISVIIRTHNSGKYLEQCLQSAVHQTLSGKLYEILVVDDGSTDNTLRILASYKDAVRLIKLKHIGAIRTLNLGLRRAQGEYVILLDHDDTLEPTILEKMYTVLEKHQYAAFSHSDYYEYDERTKKRRTITTKKNIFNAVAGGIMFKKAILEEVGFFDETLFFPEYDLLIKILRKHEAIYIPKPLYNYRRRPHSMTKDRKKVQEGIKQLFDRYGKKFPIRKY